MGTDHVVSALTGNAERDTALVEQAKGIFAAQESTIEGRRLSVVAAKALSVVGRLRACREENRKRFRATPASKHGEVLKLDKELKEIDKNIAALTEKYSLADATKAAQAVELGDLVSAYRAQAENFVFALDRFVTHTPDAYLREELGKLSGRLRFQFDVTAEAPVAPAPEVEGGVADRRDQVRGLVGQLQDLLAKTTDPGLRETFGELVDRLERQFGLKALTGDRSAIGW